MCALDRHLTVVAERKAAHAVNIKLIERARRLSRHHIRVPLVWTEYVRRVPGVVVVDATSYRPEVIEVEAEKAAVALGDDIDALWAKRKLMEAERMVLWSKIAFRSVAEMELADQPLYRFDLKSAASPLDAQRTEIVKAVAEFVRVIDHLANQAQEAVDADPGIVYKQWHKQLGAARLHMQDTLLSQQLVAMEVYKPESDAGRLAADAKQLADLAQTLEDAERALSAAENAGDDEEADASRATLQQALADTAGAVAELDKSIAKAAVAWNIAVVPGTKTTFAELPDLAGTTRVAVAPLVAPAVVPVAPVAPVVAPAAPGAVPVAINPARLQPGLVGEYYSGMNRDQLKLTRIDPVVDFHWDRGQPPAAGCSTPKYSARWTGVLMIPAGGAAGIGVDADDAAKLFLDGREILSFSKPHQEFVHGNLAAGPHVIELHYHNRLAGGHCHLHWVLTDKPDREVTIPDTALFHAVDTK